MARKKETADDTGKMVRLNLLLSEDVYEYVKTIGTARYGSMTKYIETVINKDREAWKDNEIELRKILSRE